MSSIVKVMRGVNYFRRSCGRSNCRRAGDNGYVCMVMRGFAAPTYTPPQLRDLVYDSALRAPICFDPNATRTVMPYYELLTKLGMAGKAPEQISAGILAADDRGEHPKRN